MQDQGKQILLAVVLIVGVFLAWNAIFHKDEPPPGATTPATSAKQSPAAASAGPSGIAHVGPAESGPPGEAPAAAETIQLAFPRFVATFSSACGGLSSWKLTDKRYEHDATGGELLSIHVKTKAGGASMPADLPACGAFDVNFVTASSTHVVPRRAIWKGEKVSPTEVRYVYTSDQLEIVKSFTITPDKYLVRMAVKVAARGGGEVRLQLAVTAYEQQDPEELKNGSSRIAARVWSSASLRDDSFITTDVAGVLESPRFEPSREHPQGPLRWTGFDHPYLLAGYAPHETDGVTKQTWAADGSKGRPRGFMQTDILYPAVTLRGGDAGLARTVVGYLGPKNYDDLQGADLAAGFSTGLDKVVDLGWFAFIGRPLLWLLQKFQELVGNWGIAIILLTIVVKLVTLYWTTKSMRSMKQMAALAPQLKALQAKYGDDKQRQQAETMALYKQHGVNPVAGCLPMLLQMPVWIALYRMLASAGELYLQPFIPGWINDLTATDPYYVLPATLFISMFLQARLQPATGDSAQQKFLQYGMPIMFGVFSLFFPSGLTLYMFTNNVLSALHSIYMNKFDKQSLAIAAQLKKNQETAAGAMGGGKPGAAAKPGVSAKPVLDAKATETVDDGEEDGDEPDDRDATSGGGAGRNRPRRKKRRR